MDFSTKEVKHFPPTPSTQVGVCLCVHEWMLCVCVRGRVLVSFVYCYYLFILFPFCWLVGFFVSLFCLYFPYILFIVISDLKVLCCHEVKFLS